MAAVALPDWLDFRPRLSVVSDLLRSGAARWEEDRLISTVPHSRVTL
jgi:hypothetical protein